MKMRNDLKNILYELRIDATVQVIEMVSYLTLLRTTFILSNTYFTSDIPTAILVTRV